MIIEPSRKRRRTAASCACVLASVVVGGCTQSDGAIDATLRVFDDGFDDGDLAGWTRCGSTPIRACSTTSS
jgi:hypothetical protein